MLWEAAQMKHLQRRKDIRMARAYFCQFGLPWRKATGLLCSFCNTVFVERRCTGCRGICAKSKQPQRQFAGIDPATRKFWTHPAEPYPRGLCTAMFKMLIDARNQFQHMRLGEKLQF